MFALQETGGYAGLVWGVQTRRVGVKTLSSTVGTSKEAHMTGKFGACIVAALLALSLAGAAAQAGDAAKGEALAKGCSCHKSKGDLNAMPEAELMAKMQAYKAGQGTNKAMITIMQKVADADLPDLAAYYAGLAAVKK